MILKPPSEKDIYKKLTQLHPNKAFQECFFYDEPKWIDSLVKEFKCENRMTLLFMATEFKAVKCVNHILNKFNFSKSEIKETLNFAKEKLNGAESLKGTLLEDEIYKIGNIIHLLYDKKL